MAYISQLDVSLNKDEEQKISERGFKQLPGKLNKGAGGNDIYLWYKEGRRAITQLQITFNDEMASALKRAKYNKIEKSLNDGTAGDRIYLWSFQGSEDSDNPIVEIDVTTDAKEAAKFALGWEKLACDLNRGAGGADVFIWVKREKPTYICDIKATDSYGSDDDLFGSHYIRVDEDTNRGARGGSNAFIWYRQTTDPKLALTDLKVSVSEKEAVDYQQRKYEKVNTNLNNGSSDSQVYLWYEKKGSNKPIKTITLLLNTAWVNEYRKAGLIVNEKDLNTGNDGRIVNLCVYQ